MSPHQLKHFDAETLAKFSSLELKVKAVVEGTLAGLHRSWHYGSSVEFAEHKEYTAGDDPRRLDWKAFAKFDRYYIRQFEDETELKAFMLLDCSGSMGYGTPLTKLEYCSVLIASLSYFLSRQGDQISLLLAGNRVRRYLPPRPRNSHVMEILTVLDGVRASGNTNLARGIRYLSQIMTHRNLVFVFSDLLDTEGEGLRLLRYLRARRNHVILFHLLHPDELNFPFHQVAQFESMEDSQAILVDPGMVRSAYQKEFNKFLVDIRSNCEEGEIDYHQVSTAEPMENLLMRFLNKSSSRK